MKEKLRQTQIDRFPEYYPVSLNMAASCGTLTLWYSDVFCWKKNM